MFEEESEIDILLHQYSMLVHIVVKIAPDVITALGNLHSMTTVCKSSSNYRTSESASNDLNIHFTIIPSAIAFLELLFECHPQRKFLEQTQCRLLMLINPHICSE